ncbi:hypothetical protein, partial [Microbacterium arabinogalactanolyticum]
MPFDNENCLLIEAHRPRTRFSQDSRNKHRGHDVLPRRERLAERGEAKHAQALYYKEAFNSARRQRVRAQKVTFSPRRGSHMRYATTAINIIAAQYKYFFTLIPLCNLIARREKNKVII